MAHYAPGALRPPTLSRAVRRRGPKPCCCTDLSSTGVAVAGSGRPACSFLERCSAFSCVSRARAFKTAARRREHVSHLSLAQLHLSILVSFACTADLLVGAAKTRAVPTPGIVRSTRRGSGAPSPANAPTLSQATLHRHPERAHQRAARLSRRCPVRLQSGCAACSRRAPRQTIRAKTPSRSRRRQPGTSRRHETPGCPAP